MNSDKIWSELRGLSPEDLVEDCEVFVDFKEGDLVKFRKCISCTKDERTKHLCTCVEDFGYKIGRVIDGSLASPYDILADFDDYEASFYPEELILWERPGDDILGEKNRDKVKDEINTLFEELEESL